MTDPRDDTAAREAARKALSEAWRRIGIGSVEGLNVSTNAAIDAYLAALGRPVLPSGSTMAVLAIEWPANDPGVTIITVRGIIEPVGAGDELYYLRGGLQQRRDSP